jgi:radical SAM superfamily enzyme with C-terminal helix-hairpin-helix motif
MSRLSKPLRVLCGPAGRYGFGMAGGIKTHTTSTVEDVFDVIANGDGEIVISELLKNKFATDKIDPSVCRKDAHSISGFAVKGSDIVKNHPFYPEYLICEVETYRGCSRSIVGGCSFCSEPSKGSPDFRPIQDIIDEIKALYNSGVRHFRLGNQPCIFSYMAKNADQEEFPRPNPEAIERLFKGIHSVAPDLKTLHIDNANPGILARYPEESRCIAKTIIKYHTSGDVAALGVESVDPDVIKKNNLKATKEEVFSAIKLLNDVGSKRGFNGMPELLPGLNFVFGLNGETKKTFELNFEFLKNVLDENLLLRRINLRQIIPIPGTRMYETGNKIVMKNKAVFKRFKKRVREEVEQPMLKKLLPNGTVLKDVYSEKTEGKVAFGRQLGSYPLLVGIPGIQELNRFFDVKVVGYGFRSITGLPHPLDINTASRESIEALPGVGKKRAIRVLAGRPFKNLEQLKDALDDPVVVSQISEFISF